VGYSLERVSDGAGDAGPMSLLLKMKSDGTVVTEDGKPKVGFHVRVGAPYTRSYEARDYWTTTVVQEILEEAEGYVKFRTRNSVYVWRAR